MAGATSHQSVAATTCKIREAREGGACALCMYVHVRVQVVMHVAMHVAMHVVVHVVVQVESRRVTAQV